MANDCFGSCIRRLNAGGLESGMLARLIIKYPLSLDLQMLRQTLNSAASTFDCEVACYAKGSKHFSRMSHKHSENRNSFLILTFLIGRKRWSVCQMQLWTWDLKASALASNIIWPRILNRKERQLLKIDVRNLGPHLTWWSIPEITWHSRIRIVRSRYPNRGISWNCTALKL